MMLPTLEPNHRGVDARGAVAGIQARRRPARQFRVFAIGLRQGTAESGVRAGILHRSLSVSAISQADRQQPADREQGPIEMRKLFTAACTAAVLLTGSIATSAPGAAQELSQKSIESLMEYAWAITPDRFTKPNGQTVIIEKNNRKAVEVPLDMAREVIRVGRLSAHAQVCDLKEEHALNFRTMMGREALKKKWSEQQMVFMNQLHIVTVMLLTGQLKVIASEEKDGKDVQVSEENVGKKATCSAEQRTKVRDAIVAYVKAGPQVTTTDTAAGGPAPATPAATPTSAPAKK